MDAVAQPRPTEGRRRARTRTALLNAAQTLFADRSVDGVSVDDIVLKADVAKGSFYNHFTDKDDLAREIGRIVRAEIEALVTKANDDVGDPLERMARAVCVFINFALSNRERANVVMRLNPGATLAHTPSNAGLKSDLERGLANGSFAGLSVEAAIPFVMGIVQTTMSLALEARRPEPFKSEVETIVRALLRGLGVADALATTTAHNAVSEIIQEGGI